MIPLISHQRLLVDDLVQPEQVFNVDADMPGYYVFGNDNFQVMNMPIANILHRSMAGRHEDFVLGVISVLLIALLSEILQTVLMRTRKRRVTSDGLHTAVVLDEVYHFRNVWKLLRHNPRNTRRGSTAKRTLYHSLVILGLAGMLLAAEVFAVYLTQPKKVYASSKYYNLIGQQPARTSEEVALHIDDLTRKKRCVTPSMKNSNQTREYTLNACVVRNLSSKVSGKRDKALWVDVSSWYHEAGSDHEIVFGDGVKEGLQMLETRAFVMVSTSGLRKGIRFRVTDNDSHEGAKYLQKLMIYTAMQWHCDKELDDRTCDDVRKELKDMGELSSETVYRKILLWETSEGGEWAEIRGIKTHFEIEMRNPFRAIEVALRVFATSAFIREVAVEQGMYFDAEKASRESSMEGLLSEEGRVAGIVMLSVIFSVLLVVLLLLRIFLRPASLARLAMSAVSDSYDDSDDFRGSGPKLGSKQNLQAMVSDWSEGSHNAASSQWKAQVLLGRSRDEARDAVDITEYDSDFEEHELSITISGSSIESKS